MQNTYEAVIQRISSKKGEVARLIIFECLESGSKCVFNICESSTDTEKDIDRASRFFADVLNLLEVDGKVSYLNVEDVDFGRAKRNEAKIKKIINSKIAEEQ